MTENKKISYEEYKRALDEKERLEKYPNHPGFHLPGRSGEDKGQEGDGQEK